MRKFVGALVLVVFFALLAYQNAGEQRSGEQNVFLQSPVLVSNLARDQGGAKPTPVPTPTPTPLPSLFFTEPEIESGQVTVLIPKIGIEAPLEVAQEELGENGPVFTKPGENPLWVPEWGAEIGAEGVAFIYGHRQWGPVPRIFSSLDKLEPGDIVRIESDEEILIFVVFDIAIVDPEHDIFWPFFFAMDEQALALGVSQIALVTCTPWGTDNLRLIVFAQLLEDF